MPAFTISELTEAFQIGFLIFLPFIVIDLVIANILMAMGMMMLSPTVVSLPFKLLLFVHHRGLGQARPRSRAVLPVRGRAQRPGPLRC